MSLLIIEDDEPFLELMLRSLKPTAYRVAHTIGEAFRLIDEQTPEVIFLDLSLPGSHVDDTLGRIGELRGRSKEANIIVITGYPDFKRMQDAAMAAGAKAVFSKDDVGLFGRMPQELVTWARADKPSANPITQQIEETVKKIVTPQE